MNRLKLSFMSPTTARRTSSKEKMNGEQKNLMHRFANVKKNQTIQTNHIYNQ